MAAPSIHASAVLVGSRAILIRGPSGSGKSHLALSLLQAAESGELTFARLVGDDRVHVEASHGRLLVRPAGSLAGMIEVRGLGIRRVPHESVAVVSLVVEMGTSAGRLPGPGELEVVIEQVRLPRLAVAEAGSAMPLLLSYLRTGPVKF